jgi:peptide chain release factor 1
VKFSAVLLFMVLWFTFSYLPIAHMVWFWAGPDAYTDAKAAEAAAAGAGFLFQKGALDFAGGTVVHINAGIAGLVGCLVIGPRLGFKTEPMDVSDGAYTFAIKGDGAYSIFKFEGGTHRVQRVPVTESQGRIHTSTATVAVLPEAEEVDVQVDPNDLEIDVYRSSGPGGQSVNTTDSAVRITHKPSGIVVSMQDEKSQLQNRDKAMRVLRARLYERAIAEQQAALSADRRAQVGTGERAEKIRTYNYGERRVTDHRVKLTQHNLEQVLEGELDEFSGALQADEKRRKLEAQAAAA